MNDVTTRVQVLGQNTDGSLNVRMDGGNPFGGGSPSTAMTPYSAGTSRQFTLMIGNQQVNFATEADMLKAQMALQGGSTGVSPLGTPGGTNWLQVAGNAASAINNLFARSNLDRKIQEFQRALAESNDARQRLQAMQSKYPDLIPVLTDALNAERRATEAASAALEDMMAANGIAIGVDVARVASDFLDKKNNSTSIFQQGGSSSALLAGGVGLGAGLLAARALGKSDR